MGAKGGERSIGAYRVFKNLGLFLSESRGKSKMRFAIEVRKFLHVFHLCTCLFLQMEFGQCFALSDFQKVLFFILMEFFKEIFAQAVHMSVSCNVDPSENNHG